MMFSHEKNTTGLTYTNELELDHDLKDDFYRSEVAESPPYNLQTLQTCRITITQMHFFTSLMATLKLP